MHISSEAKEISKVSRSEIALLYQTPKEVQMAINENRALLIKENDELAAFCLWKFLDSQWCTINTLYVRPDCRNQKYFLKIIVKMKSMLEPIINNAVIFTMHPRITDLMQGIGFRPASLFSLPLKVLAKIIANRLHPMRLVSYLKFFKMGLAIFRLKFQTLVYQKPAA